MSLRVVPVTRDEAFAFCDRHHSHLDPPRQRIANVGVASDGRLVCVAILEHPRARRFGERGNVAEVTRVASDGSMPHAASMCLAAITRAALALGWRRIVSTTLLGEAGTIYRACGYRPVAVRRGETWDREERPRDEPMQPGTKVRWEYGPEAASLNRRVDALVRVSAGNVVIPKRLGAA